MAATTGAQAAAGAGSAEPIEQARALLRGEALRDPAALGAAAEALAACQSAFDVEHVDWLVGLVADHSPLPPGRAAHERVQGEALRLLAAWAGGLQANVPEDGVAIDEPLRDDLIDSAVTFLSDAQVHGRSTEDKIRFLVEKGLNRTEIRVALAQVGIEEPTSLRFATRLRKDMVENGAAFLQVPDVMAKPRIEQLGFLRSKGLNDPEIIQACELASVDPVPSEHELAELPEYQMRQARPDMVSNGATFLQNRSVGGKSLREKLEFLQRKGLTAEEIDLACTQAKVDIPSQLREALALDVSRAPAAATAEFSKNASATVPAESPLAKEINVPADYRDDMVQKGVTFLAHPKVQSKSVAEKLSFLRNKGLTEPELEKACSASGVKYVAPAAVPKSAPSDENGIQKAVQFLSHPSTQTRPLQQKIQFLRSKGISLDDIKEAMRRAGVEMNPTSASRAISFNPTCARTCEPQLATFGQLDSQRPELPQLRNKPRPQAQVQRWRGLSSNSVSATENETQGRLDLKETKHRLEGAGEYETEARNAEGFDSVRPSAERSVAEEKQSRARIRQGQDFLLSEKSQSHTDLERAKFLLSKGLEPDEIEQAFFRVGLAFDSTQLDTTQGAESVAPETSEEARIARFLASAAGKSGSLDEKIRFLRGQDIADEKIRAGLSAAGYDGQVPLPSHKGTDEGKLQRVLSGVAFLKKCPPEMSHTNQAAFLRRKGLREDEIRAAFMQAEVPLPDPSGSRADDEQVDRGRAFLQNSKTKGSSVAERVRFLRDKGLSDQQITAAFALSGNPLAEARLREDALLGSDPSERERVKQGWQFLAQPGIGSRSASEKSEFLRGKGLSEEEVRRAFSLAGDDPGAQDVATAIRQAQSFIETSRDIGHTAQQQMEFLREKGLSEREIRSAFELAGQDLEDSVSPPDLAIPTGVRPKQFRRAVIFLRSEAAKQLPSRESKLKYLREKGLTDREASCALEAAGEMLESARHANSVRSDFVERGAQFLLDESVKAVPLEDRLVYLQQQGLTEEEVVAAAIAAKVKLVPSHISTVSTSELKEDRHLENDDMEPLGRALQRAINATVDLALRLAPRFGEDGTHGKGQEESEESVLEPPRLLSLRAITLIARGLARSRPAAVQPACVAFAGRVLFLTLDPRLFGAGSTDALSLSAVEGFLEATMEAVARASQLDVYAKNGLGQEQQVKLHFLACGDLLGKILGLWQRRSSIKFEHGILVARAVHGEFCAAASKQAMEAATDPGLACVISHLDSNQEDSFRDVAAFAAAGLLRGALTYAWATDVKESPQPRLERALLDATQDAMLRKHRFGPSATLIAARSTAPSNTSRTVGVVVALGLACVYADTEITWTPSVVQAVSEGLFHEALWCPAALEISDATLEERLIHAREFADTEIFKLGPQLVSLLLGKLPSEAHLLKQSQLASWLVNRMHEFSAHAFMSCRLTPALCGVVARRTVHLVYGTGREAADASETDRTSGAGEQLEPDNGPSQPPDQHVGWGHRQEASELHESQGEANSQGANNHSDEMGSGTASSATADPLEAFLGVHSKIARILQMGYLAIVVLGLKCLPAVESPSAVDLLDALANLNAFQVRVPEAIELEGLLQAIIGLGSPLEHLTQMGVPRAALTLALHSLLRSHSQLGETAQVIGSSERTQDLADWVLGARIEFLLSMGDPWLLDALVLAARWPVKALTPEESVLCNADRVLDIERASRRTRCSVSGEASLRTAEDCAKLSLGSTLGNVDRAPGSEGLDTGLHLPDAVHDNLSTADGHGEMYRVANDTLNVLIGIGVAHPFVHLNMRAHRWLTTIIACEIVSQSATRADAPPLRLAVVPRYVEAMINAHPRATPTKLLSFGIASIFTALGSDPDHRARSMAVIAFDRLLGVVDDRMAGRGADKADTAALVTLLFTCLKAVPIPAMAAVLESAADLIDRAPAHGDVESEVGIMEARGEDPEALERDSSDLRLDGESVVSNPLLSHLGLVENLFGVISRTEDTPRRTLLAKWMLERIQRGTPRL